MVSLILLTTIFGVLGLFMLIREGRMSLALLFLLPMCVFPVPYYITHAEIRFRLVMEPLLIMLGSYAASRLARHQTMTQRG